MFRRVNDISLHPDHVSSLVMHDTAKPNLETNDARETFSMQVVKLMEKSFDPKGPRKMTGGVTDVFFRYRNQTEPSCAHVQVFESEPGEGSEVFM
jgi:hypothetical protein